MEMRKTNEFGVNIHDDRVNTGRDGQVGPTMRPIVSNSALMKQYQETCSLNTIRHALGLKGLPLARKFTDLLDEKKAIELEKVMTGSDMAEMLRFLNSQKGNVARSLFNATTVVPTHECTAIYGREVVKIRNSPEEDPVSDYGPEGNADNFCTTDVKFSGGVEHFGGKPHIYGGIIRTTVAALKVKKSQVKSASGSTTDSEAFPPAIVEVMKETMADFSTMDESTMMTLHKQLKFASVRENLTKLGKVLTENAKVVTVITREDGKDKITKSKIMTYNGNGRNIAKMTDNRTAVSAPIDKLRSNLSRFQSLISKKGMSKICTDVYLGLPFGKSLIPHVISLYDAGVKYGDKVLVDTSDVNLVLLLRANFGNFVWGKGTKYPLIPRKDWEYKKYDWIYFPKPIHYNNAGTKIDAAITELNASLSSMSLNVQGKPIFYVGALAVYHASMAHFMGVSRETNDFTQPEFVSAGVSQTIQDPDVPQHYRSQHPVVVHVYPTDPMEISEELLTREMSVLELSKDVYSKICAAKRKQCPPHLCYTLRTRVEEALDFGHTLKGYMTKEIAAKKEVHLKASILSFKGNLLYSEGMKAVSLPRAMGEAVSYLMYASRSIWYAFPWSRNTYEVRKVEKSMLDTNLDQITLMHDAYVTEEVANLDAFYKEKLALSGGEIPTYAESAPALKTVPPVRREAGFTESTTTEYAEGIDDSEFETML